MNGRRLPIQDILHSVCARTFQRIEGLRDYVRAKAKAMGDNRMRNNFRRVKGFMSM